MYSIYKITNTKNQKVYIGQTSKSLEERFASHVRLAKRGEGFQLAQALRKYGVDSFIIEKIDSAETLPEALKLEAYYISDVYNSFEMGYNASIGGIGGDVSNYDSWKKAMVDYHSKKPREEYATRGMAGKTHDEEAIKKMSSKRQEYWDSKDESERAEHGKKISGPANGMYGKIPKNAKSYRFKGVVYRSLREATEATGHSGHYIKKHGERL